HGHRAVEGVDAPAQGRRAVRLVGVDRAVGQRQRAVLAVDPTAQGGTGGDDLVAVDDGVGEGGVAAGGAEAASTGRSRVVDDVAGGDAQRALVGDAAAEAGGVAADEAVGQ